MARYRKLGAIAYVEPEAYDEEVLRDKLARPMLPQIKRALKIHTDIDFVGDEDMGWIKVLRVDAILRIKTEEQA